MTSRVFSRIKAYRRRDGPSLGFLTIGILMMAAYFAYPLVIGDFISGLMGTFSFQLPAQGKLNLAVVPPLLIGVLSQGAILMSYVNIIRVTAGYWWAIVIFSVAMAFWLPRIFSAGYALALS